MTILTCNTSLQGLENPLSLGQDGSPGSIPFPWPLQAVLVWGAGAKENLKGQFWIREKEKQQVGLHPHQGGDLIHVFNVIHLNCVAGCLHIPETQKRRWNTRSSGGTTKIYTTLELEEC